MKVNSVTIHRPDNPVTLMLDLFESKIKRLSETVE